MAIVYTECKYIKDPMNTNKIDSISCKIDGKKWTIPIDEFNADYMEIKKLVDAGELTIEEAD